MLEFAGAFLEDFELGLGESEHFYLGILDVIFLMIILEAIGLFFDRRCRQMTQMNADKLGPDFLGMRCICFLGQKCDRPTLTII